MIDRRTLLAHGVAFSGAALIAPIAPGWAESGSAGFTPDMPTLSGEDIALRIENSSFTVGGRIRRAVTINGTLPAPLIRLRQGQNVRISVTNVLTEDTSIHWHGVLVPFQFDGVPGVSFPGIRPGETFVYEFPILHAGTFWYHSHSGLQEQLGHYGPLIFDPEGDDPVAFDREYVLMLSDWTFMNPHKVLRRLKQESDFFNRQQLTLRGLLTSGNPEERPTFRERLMWAKMRMDPTDISDVTAFTYTYLINGKGPEENWLGLYRPGERIRLRIINASAMTVFNFRIPGLRMTMVQADGNNIRPVVVDEFQIAVAETYDVLVEPVDGSAYSIVAEAVDRSGLASAILAPRPGMTAEEPLLRPRPTLGMADMGMTEMSSMEGMDHGAANHGAMNMNMRDPKNASADMKVGVGVDMISPNPQDRTDHPGLGLTEVAHKVLTYRDLVALDPNPDPRPPSRTLEIHLTGNMERFMWSFDGSKFSEIVEPIRLARNERVRVTLINDTMMQHPIHLHGHFFEIVNGNPGYHPMKHTVNVLPGSRVTFDLTADNPGDWALHCHLLLHMHAGMFNVVTVRPLDGDAT